jgi:formate hydrogenlyase transcriptional activator
MEPAEKVSPDASALRGEEKFHRLLESAPDAMVIVEPGGRIVLVNAQAEKIFGYSRDELTGQPVEMLLPETSRQAHVHHRSGYAAAPHARPMGSGLELFGRRKDGSVFPVEISLSPLEDAGSQLFMSAIRDVTENKRTASALRRSEEYYRLLVDEVKDYAIFMLDTEGRVTGWNKGAERVKGYQANEIIGRHFSVFYPAEDVERGKPVEELKLAAAAGRWEDEGWRIRKDGSRFWANVVITAVHGPDLKLIGFSKVTRDVTEEKRAREAFLLEITNTLVSKLDAQQLLSSIASCLHQLKQFDFATLALYDAPTGMLRLQPLGSSAHAAPAESELMPVASSPAGLAYVSRKPVLITGLPGEDLPSEIAAQLVHEGGRSGCWIPLIGREGALGTLNLFSRRAGAFTEEDLNALSPVARQVAMALDNAMAFQRVSELTQRLAEQKQYLEDELRTEFNFEEIVGESKALKRVLKQVETVAPTDSTVLILGETGTGKELLARSVHDLSGRRAGTFVRINCASIPAGLLESELFGHEKGAFTGALTQRTGRFELANHGTLFLDEVGDLPLELQPKLLRVIQEHEFERLGSNKTITTDVRIIAATNHDLGKLVAHGQFRSDLFYRLHVFPITVPPLRERREDIPLLVQYFVSKYASRMKRQIESVPPEAMDALTRYPWPGNIRELEHLVERAVILSRGSVLAVPPFEPLPAEEASAASTLEGMERQHILRVLREAGGKIGGPGGAAERLGMNRTTLNSRMLKLNISRKDL